MPSTYKAVEAILTLLRLASIDVLLGVWESAH
jgi:hypothetical protein